VHAWRVIITVVLGLVAVALVLVWLGYTRQRRATSDLIEEVTRAAEHKSASVDFESLSELPDPVEKYFRLVLADGQPCIRLARFTQRGELRINERSDRWSRFTASQVVDAGTPGFVWDARVSVTPLLHVRVRDGYVAGRGSGVVTLLSALTVASESDRPELNSGALHRYLAEAVWYPTALLPSAGVEWSAIDGTRALAKLTDSGVSVSLEFRFNDVGEVTGIYAAERWGRFGDTYELIPWEGRFGNYTRKQGVLVPTTGEVGWHRAGGFWSFWKGQLLDLNYDYGD
jgi:hypothetical protein